VYVIGDASDLLLYLTHVALNRCSVSVKCPYNGAAGCAVEHFELHKVIADLDRRNLEVNARTLWASRNRHLVAPPRVG
jgi:hypothetical protein